MANLISHVMTPLNKSSFGEHEYGSLKRENTTHNSFFPAIASL